MSETIVALICLTILGCVAMITSNDDDEPKKKKKRRKSDEEDG